MIEERQIHTIEFQPGVYDISNDEYQSSPGISRTGIMTLRKSALHYYHRYLNQTTEAKEQTKALYFGSALHTYILENDKFDKEYFISEKNPYHGSSTAGKEFKADMLIRSRGKILIERDDVDIIKSMSSSLFSDSQVAGLLTGAKYERSIYWIDPDTGILCKCRPDIWHSNMIGDLKTAVDASPYEFQHDIYRYGYHIQAAMIQDAIRIVLNHEMLDFIYIVVEKTPPYAVAVYILDQESINKGREEYKYRLAQYKDCLETNNWPGYQTKQISLPKYVYYLQE